MSHRKSRVHRDPPRVVREAAESDPTFWRAIPPSWWGDEGELSLPPEGAPPREMPKRRGEGKDER
jgi:hypothetical protein